jgi:hypothetical protein
LNGVDGDLAKRSQSAVVRHGEEGVYSRHGLGASPCCVCFGEAHRSGFSQKQSNKQQKLAKMATVKK